MSTYAEFIAAAQLVDSLEYTITTGDPDYPGTAVEVCDSRGEELFHVVIGSAGKPEVLFFQGTKNYRIPLETLGATLMKARRDVRVVEE